MHKSEHCSIACLLPVLIVYTCPQLQFTIPFSSFLMYSTVAARMVETLGLSKSATSSMSPASSSTAFRVLSRRFWSTYLRFFFDSGGSSPLTLHIRIRGQMFGQLPPWTQPAHCTRSARSSSFVECTHRATERGPSEWSQRSPTVAAWPTAPSHPRPSTSRHCERMRCGNNARPPT